MKWRPIFVWRGLLVFACLTLPIGLGELGLRLAGRMLVGSWPTTSAVQRYHAVQETLALYRLHPFTNVGPRAGGSLELHGKRAELNELGFRSPERSLARSSPQTLRVLTAGGSTTFDLLAEDDRSSWPQRLERALVEERLEVEVWNAGFPGWTSLENLISLAARDVLIEPDVVLLYQGINDLQPASAQPFDPTYEKGHADVHRRAMGFDLPPPTLLERSVLVERLRALFRPSQNSRADPAHQEVARRSQLPQAAVATFRRHLRSFHAIAQAHGARVVLMTQPLHLREGTLAADRAYVESWIPGFDATLSIEALERFNDVVCEVALDSGAVLFDAAREIDWQDEDFADPMHYSALGSEKLARYVAEQLASRVLEVESREGRDERSALAKVRR